MKNFDDFFNEQMKDPAFKEEYENAIVLRKMLKEYRKCKNRDFENIS